MAANDKRDANGLTGLGDVAAAVAAGGAAATLQARFGWVQPPPGSDGRVRAPVPVAVDGNGNIRVADSVIARMEQEAARPARRNGTYEHHQIESFCDFVNRYKAPSESVVWADVDNERITCVFDADPRSDATGPNDTTTDDPAGWEEHRAVYTAPLSTEWKEWTGRNGVAMGQDAFATWLEDHLEDLAEADGFPRKLDLVDMARNLRVYTKGAFERKTDPVRGTIALVAKTETAENSTPIPRAFMLGIPVFRGSQIRGIEARIRFSLEGGAAKFSYHLHRADEHKRIAFDELVTIAITETALPVYVGPAPEV